VADSTSALSGTLLRQTQPTTGSHVWEPYVLYYQEPKYFYLQELVLTSTGWEKSLYFGGGGITPYKGSPITVGEIEGGYGLQLFWLRANDTRLLTHNATFSTLNESSYDDSRFTALLGCVERRLILVLAQISILEIILLIALGQKKETVRCTH
jgi:hypothetical protein